MTQKIEHTPTPWGFYNTGEVMKGYCQPFAISQELSANMVAGIFGDVEGGEDTAKANAEFIVRACNSHYELLEALEIALDAVKKYPDHPMTASEVVMRRALRKVRGAK
jgi:hypothetical protein